MTETVEAIVERKVAASLKRLAAALRAAAHELDPANPITSCAGEKEAVPVNTNGCASDASQGAAAHDATRHSSAASNTGGQLRQIIFDTLAENLPSEDFDDDTDLFKFGLDSLQISSLLTAINAFIVKSQQPVDLIQSEVIYSNPTISKMVAVVAK